MNSGRAFHQFPARNGYMMAWVPPTYANRHVFARNDKELVRVSLAPKP
jgi:hypothetical protein